MRKIVVLSAACVLLLAGCTSHTPAESEGFKIASAYGLQNFDDVDEMRFIFHAQLPDKKVIRAWQWNPKNGDVRYTGNGPDGDQIQHSYNHFHLEEGDADLNRTVDAWFINDQYWLLFPFHLVWDDNMTLTLDSGQVMPISGRTSKKLTVQYHGEVGYTPGDAFDLYYGPDYMVEEWVYRRGGGEEPTRTAMWSPPVEVGPIKVSLNHPGPNPTQFRVWFTDVGVLDRDLDRWTVAPEM